MAQSGRRAVPAHVQPRGGGIWLSEAGESRDLPRSGRRLPWEGAAQMEAARQGGAGGRMQSRSHGRGKCGRIWLDSGSSMACPQVWVGISVIRKFQIGFFGFRNFGF